MSQEVVQIVEANPDTVALVERSVEVVEVNNLNVEVIEVVETNFDVIEVVETNTDVIEIIERGPQGVKGDKGDKGDAGENAPLLWIDLVSMWDTPPTFLSGTVWSYTWEGVTRYRNVPSPYDPTNDSFYSSFSGGILSGLIVSRA
jgi:hypothetical protein